MKLLVRAPAYKQQKNSQIQQQGGLLPQMGDQPSSYKVGIASFESKIVLLLILLEFSTITRCEQELHSLKWV